MKKFYVLIVSIILTIAMLCGFASFKPEAEYYIEIDSFYSENNVTKICKVYRTIELKNDKPEHRENFGLETFLVDMNTGIFDSLTITENVKPCYVENDLFFTKPNILNKEGVDEVYRCIGLEVPFTLCEERNDCSRTGLYTYNAKISGVTTSMNFDMVVENERLPKRIGYMADVDIYTFTYTDLLKEDGRAIISGEFKVIVVTGNSHLGYFQSVIV